MNRYNKYEIEFHMKFFAFGVERTSRIFKHYDNPVGISRAVTDSREIEAHKNKGFKFWNYTVQKVRGFKGNEMVEEIDVPTYTVPMFPKNKKKK